MNPAIGAITHTVPISMFNRGLAGKIFDEVKASGVKVVMKNNTAECVLLSPEEYTRIMEELENAALFREAEERMSALDRGKLISMEDIDREFGFTEEDISDLQGVDFE
ncbi:MAG: type II toxin-antitoxin system Phd/YefM family antitoxin [Oscillospiraceae bacterium]|nr:type II toxin-antitoxin system Phd/YefM family antitoxin [Oscillospiraceae bacterium]